MVKPSNVVNIALVACLLLTGLAGCGKKAVEQVSDAKTSQKVGPALTAPDTTLWNVQEKVRQDIDKAFEQAGKRIEQASDRNQ